MYGAVPEESFSEQPKGTRSPANIAVLKLGILTIITANFTSSAIFPFFPVVVREKAGSPFVVGLIFSSNPFALALIAPFVPIISQKLGRVTVLSIGLICGAASMACFGIVDDFKLWFFLRCLQGVSNALIDGPSMALLLAHSSDVAEDLGLMESAAGLSYVVGPAIGGAIYTYFGFQNTFLLLSTSYIFCLALVPYIVWGMSSDINTSAVAATSIHLNDDRKQSESEAAKNHNIHHITKSKETEKLTLLERPSIEMVGSNDTVKERGLSPLCKREEEEVAISPWTILANEPAVWVSSAASVLVWMTTNFYDVYLSTQVRQTLGIGARGRGLIYVWPALTYAIFSLFLGKLCRKIGARNVLLCGSVGHIVVLLSYGPNVYITEIASRMGFLELNYGRGFEWCCIIVAMGLWGFCLAPLFQAGLPLMHAALAAKGHLKVDESVLEKMSSEEKQRAAIQKEKIEDSLSALMQSTGASGAILGPVIGGLALEYLPKRSDPGCDPAQIFNELDDDASSDIIHCATGFAWATTIIAGLFLFVSCLILTLPNYKSVDEFEGEAVTMQMMTESPVVRRRKGHHSPGSNKNSYHREGSAHGSESSI